MDECTLVQNKGGRGGKKGVRKAHPNPMNLWMVSADDCDEGWWPKLRATQTVPSRLVTFMVADAHEHADDFCHFFIDDYRFERLWCDPNGYLQTLGRYAGLIAPDFSTYTDMPKPMQIWNAYRSRALASHWQSCGLDVIPNVQFGQEDTWGWAFDGLPKHSTLGTSCVGIYRDRVARDLFVRGMEKCVRVLEPTTLVMYGHEIPFDAGDARVVWYENDNDKRMTEHRATHANGKRG